MDKDKKRIDYDKIDKIDVWYALDFAGARHLVITDLSGESRDYVISKRTGISLGFEILSKELFPIDKNKWVNLR